MPVPDLVLLFFWQGGNLPPLTKEDQLRPKELSKASVLTVVSGAGYFLKMAQASNGAFEHQVEE